MTLTILKNATEMLTMIVITCGSVLACYRVQAPKTDICQNATDPACVKNEVVSGGGEPFAGEGEACPTGSLRTPGGCEDGDSYCATRGMLFSGSTCAPCPDGKVWDAAVMLCVGSSSPSSNPVAALPAPAPVVSSSVSSQGVTKPVTSSPEPSLPVPQVEVKLSREAGLGVYVRFSDARGVSGTKIGIAPNTVFKAQAKLSDKADAYEVSDLGVFLRVTFNFAAKTCVLDVLATEKGSGYLKPAGC